MTWTVPSAAAEPVECKREGRQRESFENEWPELDVATGYEVQDMTLEQRLNRGERLVGVKLGLTPKAKQARMNVDKPVVAWLTGAMVLDLGLPVSQDRLFRPCLDRRLCSSWRGVSTGRA